MFQWLMILFGVIILSAIINIIILNNEGICSDVSMPKGAIAFAYENMIVKDNVTFIKLEPNQFESSCEMHYWVTDANGVYYRLVWSKMHHDIKLNTSYTIHYTAGTFNALWEFE
jgi:hypothetical protein